MNKFTLWILLHTNIEQMVILTLVAIFGVGITTCIATQTFKVLLKKFVGKEKITFKKFFADGDLPSSHTATSVSAVTMGLFYIFFSANMDITVRQNFLSVAILISLVFPAIVFIRDAFGSRYRQDETNKNLLGIAQEIENTSVSDRITENFAPLLKNIKSEAFKRVGHLLPEVIAGAFSGIIGASYALILFFNIKLVFICLIVSIVYFIIMLIFLKKSTKLKK